MSTAYTNTFVSIKALALVVASKPFLVEVFAFPRAAFWATGGSTSFCELEEFSNCDLLLVASRVGLQELSDNGVNRGIVLDRLDPCPPQHILVDGEGQVCHARKSNTDPV